MFGACLAGPQDCAAVYVEQVTKDDVPTVNFAGSGKLRTPHVPGNVKLDYMPNNGQRSYESLE